MSRASDRRQFAGETYEDRMLSEDAMGTYDDDYDRWLDEEDFERHRPPLTCKRCGSTDVRWRQQGGKWVLFSLTPGKLHECDLADEFK